jgi:hypothetical protein
MTKVAKLILMIAVSSSPALLVEAAVEHWKPVGIASDQFESHPAFDPLNGDFYFVRSNREFRGWRILVSRCTAAGWMKPQSPTFAADEVDAVEADPAFGADGHTMYFISSRSSNGVKRRDLDIWRVRRDAKGEWLTPHRLPSPVNSDAHEWFPRPAGDGWLYFGSGRTGGVGKTDIWRARELSADRWNIEHLGRSINSEGHEYEPLVAPDGQRIIVATDNGFYEARRGADGAWLSRVRLSDEVNVNGSEIGPLFSPDGRALLFARDTQGADSGEFFVFRADGEGVGAWHPACGAQ